MGRRFEAQLFERFTQSCAQAQALGNRAIESHLADRLSRFNKEQIDPSESFGLVVAFRCHGTPDLSGNGPALHIGALWRCTALHTSMAESLEKMSDRLAGRLRLRRVGRDGRQKVLDTIG